jgi:hypothetical protein
MVIIVLILYFDAETVGYRITAVAATAAAPPPSPSASAKICDTEILTANTQKEEEPRTHCPWAECIDQLVARGVLKSPSLASAAGQTECRAQCSKNCCRAEPPHQWFDTSLCCASPLRHLTVG